MKRRLDLASALVHEPEVLFLDEPTTGLDPASRLTVWDEVRRINERGTTVFLTTQYLEEADQLCDRLAIIDDGRIVREGTPAAAEGRAARAPRPGERADARRRVPRRDRPHPRPRRRRRAGGDGMSQAWVLGQRALREGWRTPEALVPTLFIPLFFLVVNIGQAAKIFPSASTAFLTARATARSSCPSSLLLAASFGTRRAVPRRGDRGRLLRQAARDADPAHAIVLGRLIAEARQGHRDRDARSCCSRWRSGSRSPAALLGFVLLVALTALWAVVFVGFMQLIALKTRSAAATNSGRPDLLPAAVPRRRTSCRATCSRGRWRSRRRSTP